MHRRSTRFIIRALTLGLLTLLVSACGSESKQSFAPIELRELVEADSSSFDVDWQAGTLVAQESDVLAALEDLQPSDGIFRVPADSPILVGVSVGSIVVWPQVGIFEIVDLEPTGDIVKVATKWAHFSDAVSRAEIEFTHELRAGEPGRVVGTAPAAAPKARTNNGLVEQALTVENGPLSFSEDGVNYQGEAGGAETSFSIDGNAISASFSSSNAGTTVGLNGSIRGLAANGRISLEAGEDDPAVRVDFKNVTLNMQATLSINGAKGTASVIPPAQLVFPFLIGPMPVYIAIGTDIEIESTIGTEDAVLTASAGFTMTGSVSVGRNRDGTIGAEGEITSFETQRPDFKGQTAFTAGIAIRFSAPRISFGIGRPGMATTAVYGTNSIEMVANAAVNPLNNDYCARLGTSSGAFIGGEISILGWSIGHSRQVAHRDGVSTQQGNRCD